MVILDDLLDNAKLLLVVGRLELDDRRSPNVFHHRVRQDPYEIGFLEHVKVPHTVSIVPKCLLADTMSSSLLSMKPFEYSRYSRCNVEIVA